MVVFHQENEEYSSSSQTQQSQLAHFPLPRSRTLFHMHAHMHIFFLAGDLSSSFTHTRMGEGYACTRREVLYESFVCLFLGESNVWRMEK